MSTDTVHSSDIYYVANNITVSVLHKLTLRIFFLKMYLWLSGKPCNLHQEVARDPWSYRKFFLPVSWGVFIFMILKEESLALVQQLFLVLRKPQSTLFGVTDLWLFHSPQFAYAVKNLTCFQKFLLRISNIPARNFVFADKIKCIMRTKHVWFHSSFLSVEKWAIFICGQLDNTIELFCLCPPTSLLVPNWEPKPFQSDGCQQSWVSQTCRMKSEIETVGTQRKKIICKFYCCEHSGHPSMVWPVSALKSLHSDSCQRLDRCERGPPAGHFR